MTDKMEAMAAIRDLSEHATLAEIIETLSILEAIRRGEKDADEGRVIPHEAIKARVASWVTK